MNWTELLTSEIEYAYMATNGLLDLVEESDLEWKPATGDNWMTTGQLIMHITNACGAAMKGFVTGDWGLPEGVNLEDIPQEEMMPTAEKMPTIDSVAAARALLSEDKETALEMLTVAGAERLETEPSPAPWDPATPVLGQRLLNMVQHLAQHKAQLFYYLKLQGKPVNTGNLWGM